MADVTSGVTSVVPLPDDPNLEQLKKQAKDYQREVRATEDPSFKLSAAQLVIARRYGFASWARLRRHLDVVARYSRAPDRVEPAANAADEFLRLACLSYGGDDGPDGWTAARALVAALPRDNIYVAAALADVGATRELLASDPALARREGGPFAWTPLFYLAYARHDPDISEAAVLDTARALLTAGADPNAGYLWHGLPTPFTVLTGVFGGGELGPERQPHHPHAEPLARVLLDANADPNDGQTLYNRMFERANDHLELLFAYGLGTGDGGIWRARLHDALEAPQVMVHNQLRWAINHDMLERVALLLAHDADVNAALADGRTPIDTALFHGNTLIIDTLVAHGAVLPNLDPVDIFIAAAMRGDRATAVSLRGHAAAARDRRPSLIVHAAASGRADAVVLLHELGFDVNALGRSDVPIEQPRETGLHVAAGDGDVEVTRVLLTLGADPEIRDARFDATPLGWAEHFDREATAELLRVLH
jgi:ankyrin repeat protein